MQQQTGDKEPIWETGGFKHEPDELWPLAVGEREVLAAEERRFRENAIYLKTYDVLIKEEELLAIVKKKLKERIQWDKEALKKNVELQREIAGDSKYSLAYRDEFKAEIEEENKELLARQKRTKHKLSFLEGKVDFHTNYFDNKLIRAREVPITDYLQINHAGFAKCLWHNEDSPSMKYYPKQNKVYCFGCHAGGDVLDVVSAMFNLDFKQALAHVLNER